MAKGRWPDGMIDSERLFELLGYTSADPEVIGEAAYQRVLDFETAVDDAYMNGRLKRFSAKDPSDGSVVGHGYRRTDLQGLLRGMPALAADAAKA